MRVAQPDLESLKMGTLRGFPSPPALWLQACISRPWAKPAFAYAISQDGNPERVPIPSRALAPAG
jgi:hypothetical protein